MSELEQLEAALGSGHGCLFFSPSKGYCCDLLCGDSSKSWVSGRGTGVASAVRDALEKKAKVESV